LHERRLNLIDTSYDAGLYVAINAGLLCEMRKSQLFAFQFVKRVQIDVRDDVMCDAKWSQVLQVESSQFAIIISGTNLTHGQLWRNYETLGTLLLKLESNERNTG